jgi:hypothetical protein
MKVQYEPLDKPVVGGHSATFGPFLRNFGRGTAIAATKRVLESEPYEPTGDKAFDTRAEAFRNVLISGRPEIFEETPEGFLAVGL